MRVHVQHEVMKKYPSDWKLCFQWCLYLYDDGEIEKGYRFIWRRPDTEGGGLQPARGQARIPSIKVAKDLIKRASDEGWGDYDADKIGGNSK